MCAARNWAQGKVATIEERLPDGTVKRHDSPTSTDGDLSNGYQLGVCPSFSTKHPRIFLLVDLLEVYISVETIYYITPVGPGGKFDN